jgi:mevalonate kinase
MKIKVSAPGKLMIFGEHAVVYNRPCIVTAVSSRIHVTIETKKEGFTIDAPQVKDVRFVEETLRIFKEKFAIDFGLSIKTKSDFSSLYGFGSSSAVTVALLYGLAKIGNINLTREEIFRLGYEINLRVQGVGSGFDIAAATFGKTLYFFTGGKIIKPLKIKKLPLVVGYSGIKADTPKIVRLLKEKIDKKREEYEKIFDQIKKIIEEGKTALEKEDWKKTGFLMNKNHQLLQKLGVSTEKLDQMCQAALDNGAYGAKLSGAGGGDCMIALVNEKTRERVERAIELVGGEIIKVNANALGVGEDEDL